MTAGPPLTEILATTPQEDELRKTHIEVCVRIRPLVIGKESSTSFLLDRKSNNNGNLGIPRTPTKLGTPTRSKLPRNKAAPSGIPQRHVSSSTPMVEAPHRGPCPVDEPYAWHVTSVDTVQQSAEIENLPGRTDSYTLDHVYGPQATTKDLYDKSVAALVQAAMDGYHTSVLAYGQTSTGKTHTMTGTEKQPGLIPLAIRECFDYVQNISQPREYLIRMSYMEVYKEHIRDLLVDQHAAQPAPIRLFETAADGLVIKGLREEVVTNSHEVFSILAEGEARRQVGATLLNAHSSRSHVIVRLWIESRALPEGGGAGMQQRLTSTSSTTSSLASSSPLGAQVRVSSLSLVDLAGSESVKLTGNNERRQEGHYINQSLMTLGKVVYALSEAGDDPVNSKKSTKHIPYRDSKLTRLLQPSLSGNAQVVLVCCISPLAQHIEESHNTLKFAVRAKKIPQKAVIQEAPDEERTLLQSYRDEIEELKRQLKEAREAKESNQASTAVRKLGRNGLSQVDLVDVVSEDEIQELVSSIQTMEKLILKSKPVSPMLLQHPEDLLDSTDFDEGDDNADWEDLIALATTNSEATSSMSRSLQTPLQGPDDTDKNLQIELSRIQGLLGAVLKKRKQQKVATSSLNSARSEQEVANLRAQLEQQEVASNIRKADSSFLQKQLDEKDDLLLEVSKILEAVEQRQVQLEKENAALRAKLAALQNRLAPAPATTTTDKIIYNEGHLEEQEDASLAILIH